MSENGKTNNEEGTLIERMFTSLAGRNRRKSTPVEQPAQRPPSKEELYAHQIAPWLSEPAAIELLVPHLEDLIAQARYEAHLNVRDHAATAYWLGMDAGLSRLLDEILTIRGQA